VIFLPSLLAAAALAATSPQAAAADAFLAAAASGDLAAARAALGDHITIMDSRGAAPVESSLEAFADYARGCRAGDPAFELDPRERERAALTITWTCPSRAATQDMIWMQSGRVVWIQFGSPAPE
jgi:hypothetical protein